MDERRLEVRMLCADMVDVRWRRPLQGRMRHHGNPGGHFLVGACLQVEDPIPLGVEIRWDQPKQQFQGYVRYCVYREIGYFVGVEFDASFKWSKKAFKPQHLLDLQALVGQSKKG